MEDAPSAPRTFLRACGGLTHPVALLAVATLALNDHVGKGLGPGWLTGKLSDVAGLAFFPLLLEALCEAALALTGRYRGPSIRLSTATLLATAVGFSWVKQTAQGGEAYSQVLRFLQLPMRAAIHGCDSLPAMPHTLADPTDLVALLALVVPLVIARRRAREFQRFHVT